MPVTAKPDRSIRGRLNRLNGIIHEYPAQFWVVVFGTFVDRLGGAMLFPFFTLFITKKFHITLTEAGLMLLIFSVPGMFGSTLGGALTDKFGRKTMIIFSLVMSATSAILMGVINEITLFIMAVVIVGFLSDTGGPARDALIADLLPEEKRADGYGILRVGFNLSVAIGPLIGGVLASYNYLFLFIADAVASTITAMIVFFVIKETWKPAEHQDRPQETLAQTFAGYKDVFHDRAFVFYMLASMLMVLVYTNMNTMLAPFLRDAHGVNERGFSYILSLNAIMVVLFQFPITRWVSRYRPLVVMTAGTLLYAVGFAMYGFVSWYFLFLVAMAIITIGEMFVSPVGQAIATRLAPEHMRGRYMAMFGLSWGIPFMIGPTLAGMILDNLNPNILWYMAGVVGLLAALAYYAIEVMSNRASYAVVEQRIAIMEQLEQGKLTAEAAHRLLEKVEDSPLARLSPPAPATERRHFHIKVSDLASGMMKIDLRLPVGLVNTALFAGVPVSASLAPYDNDYLRDMISCCIDYGETRSVVADKDKVEVTVEQS